MSTLLRRRPAGPPAVEARGRSGGVGRASSPYAEAVSDALRRYDTPDLDRRRRAAGSTLAAIGALGVVGAYQFGLLRTVPEPPIAALDAGSVDASGEAYQLLGTPDSALGMASYAVTLALVGMGPADRATSRPLLPLLASAKAALDVVSSGYLFLEQVTKHKKLCGWCTAAAVSSLVTLPLTVPEARTAWRTLRERH